MLGIIGWIILAWLAFIGLICHIILMLIFFVDWKEKNPMHTDNTKEIYDALREKNEYIKR